MTCKTTHHMCDCMRKRMERLEAVAKVARRLFHELNCPVEEIKTGGLANFDALENAVKDLDAPSGEREKQE